MERSCNILIVGGGLIGSSVAMALAESGASGVAVLDADLSGKWSSSERNAGGVRATWAQPINIRLSRISMAYYEDIALEVGFRQKGYLWLYDAEEWREALTRMALQRRLGCQVEALEPSEITHRYPFLDRLDDIEAASFSPEDGLINANLLKQHYRRRAEASGVEWLDHQVADQVTVERGCAVSVRIKEILSEKDVAHFLGGEEPPADGKGTSLKVKILINAAGAWAPALARLYGASLPSTPVRRQISIVHSQDLDLSPYGMIVDASGLYFHPEADHILAGYSPPSEPPGYGFNYGKDFFFGEIWPRLAARSRRFERLKEQGGWAGLYAVSPDKSAIIGPVEGFSNLFEAHSFSGRGVMHSYAVGQALAERILKGRYRMIDLSCLSGSRFKRRRPVLEKMHI